ALALPLLVGATLALRRFELLTRVPPGLDPARVLMFTLSLPDGVYKDEAQSAAFYQALVGRLRQLPGTASSAAIMIPPLARSGFGGTFSIEGRPEVSGPDEPRAQVRPITPD